MAYVPEEEEVLLRFGQGVNCCMQVFSAVAEDVGISESEAVKLGAGFGGGMGLASVCGCVSGALMAIGYKYGGCEPGRPEQAARFNEKKKDFLEAFTERFGSTQCVAMLGGLDPAVPEQRAEIAQKGLMKSLCAPAVCAAVEILEDIL